MARLLRLPLAGLALRRERSGGLLSRTDPRRIDISSNQIVPDTRRSVGERASRSRLSRCAVQPVSGTLTANEKAVHVTISPMNISLWPATF